jgi:YggT family protein
MLLITSLLTYVLWALFIVVLVRVAFSWVSPFPTNSISRFAFRVTEPMLAPIRRWVPPVSGLDLSPLVLSMGIYFLIAALRSIG